MEKDTKDLNNKNLKQEAHGNFLDTLGVNISGDYKRVIDVIAAIKNIDRIEKRSLARKNIKEKTKNKRLEEMAESYDIVDAWLAEENEKEKEQKESEEADSKINDEKDTEEVELTENAQQKSEKIDENSDKENEEKTNHNVIESEKSESVNEIDNETKINEENQDESDKKTLTLSHEEKSKRYTLNKEKTLELVSNKIDSLLEKIQTAKEENSKQKSGVDIERDAIYYDDVITVLKKHRKFIDKQFASITKINGKDKLKDGNTVIILDDENRENEEKINPDDEKEDNTDEEKPIVEPEENKEEITNEPVKDEQKETVYEPVQDEPKETVSQPMQNEQKTKKSDTRKTERVHYQSYEDKDVREPKTTDSVTYIPGEKVENNQQKEETPYVEPRETMQTLDTWAEQVVAKEQKGEKIEDILKQTASTESIAEKIQKGELNIKDAKKSINDKYIKTTGKENEKVVNAVEKYLLQRTNSIIITGNSLAMIKKENFWDKIKEFFKNIGTKVKGIFNKNKDKSDKSGKDISVNKNSASLNRNEFVDGLKVEVKLDGKKYQLSGENIKIFGLPLGKGKDIAKSAQKNPSKSDKGLDK